jgi:YVTN family beta-propeller protein
LLVVISRLFWYNNNQMPAYSKREIRIKTMRYVCLFIALLAALLSSADADWVTTTVAVGTYPLALALNPVTNKIYVANYQSANVTVIDGATNGTATVPAGANPQTLAVNPVTDKVYVANRLSSTVTVIDGATNDTATVAIQPINK